jgi:ElaB/YqjD/DUF883 family membrane-anchored ribosome-binding protein
MSLNLQGFARAVRAAGGELDELLEGTENILVKGGQEADAIMAAARERADQVVAKAREDYNTTLRTAHATHRARVAEARSELLGTGPDELIEPRPKGPPSAPAAPLPPGPPQGGTRP